jgi:hypothetical protein
LFFVTFPEWKDNKREIIFSFNFQFSLTFLLFADPKFAHILKLRIHFD